MTRKTTHDAKSAERLSLQELDQVQGGIFLGPLIGTAKVTGGTALKDLEAQDKFKQGLEPMQLERVHEDE